MSAANTVAAAAQQFVNGLSAASEHPRNQEDRHAVYTCMSCGQERVYGRTVTEDTAPFVMITCQAERRVTRHALDRVSKKWVGAKCPLPSELGCDRRPKGR